MKLPILLLSVLLFLGCTSQPPLDATVVPAPAQLTGPVADSSPQPAPIVVPEPSENLFYIRNLSGTEGCYYDMKLCGEDGICLNDRCISRSLLMPGDPGSCGYDEVLVNGSCTEASYVMHFISDGISQGQYRHWRDDIIASFVYHTPLRDCPEKLRVHEDFQFCCEDSPCRAPPEGHFEDATVLLFNSTDRQEGCHPISAVNMVKVPIDHHQTYSSTPLHELGHALGLWDQYCYWPVENNPNPVDLSEANCIPLEEGDAYYPYCSNPKRLPEGTRPHLCIGNINHLGGVSTMGQIGDPSRNLLSHPDFGFTEEEYQRIAQRISCDSIS